MNFQDLVSFPFDANAVIHDPLYDNFPISDDLLRSFNSVTDSMSVQSRPTDGGQASNNLWAGSSTGIPTNFNPLFHNSGLPSPTGPSFLPRQTHYNTLDGNRGSILHGLDGYFGLGDNISNTQHEVRSQFPAVASPYSGSHQYGLGSFNNPGGVLDALDQLPQPLIRPLQHGMAILPTTPRRSFSTMRQDWQDYTNDVLLPDLQQCTNLHEQLYALRHQNQGAINAHSLGHLALNTSAQPPQQTRTALLENLQSRREQLQQQANHLAQLPFVSHNQNAGVPDAHNSNHASAQVAARAEAPRKARVSRKTSVPKKTAERRVTNGRVNKSASPTSRLSSSPPRPRQPKSKRFPKGVWHGTGNGPRGRRFHSKGLEDGHIEDSTQCQHPDCCYMRGET